MFTGLVAVTGSVAAVQPKAGGIGARMTLRAPFDLPGEGPLVLGESIAVNGACLSVDAILPDGFAIDATSETLSRTTLGGLVAGSPVHLERALRAADRLGGHLMTGHVDGVGTLIERRPVGDAVWMAFRVPAELSKFIAEKGSIAVDGVSLTVNAAHTDSFEVTLIPHTLGKTALGALAPGGRVNLEVDLIARYVARLLSPQP
ncbi:MAG TPA: riboflavin synthase [Polyangiaceae bacterium]|jgi:riboflavin synthase|nr:riboflavin synthase [Polyangiaceae bacterium]